MKKVKEYLPYVVVLIVVILIRSYIITPVRVTGSSMDKTLRNGDIMLLYKLAKLNREDIVVVNKKVNGSNIIKRIIALPGEKIKCIDGTIYINDKQYADEHAYGITSDFDEITLASDEYFVLGDNRLVSEDSRFFGAVKEKYIEGQTSIIIFSFSKIGKVK